MKTINISQWVASCWGAHVSMVERFAKTLNPCKIERMPCFTCWAWQNRTLLASGSIGKMGNAHILSFAGCLAVYSTWVRTMFDTGCLLNLPKPQTLQPGNLIAKELPNPSGTAGQQEKVGALFGNEEALQRFRVSGGC